MRIKLVLLAAICFTFTMNVAAQQAPNTAVYNILDDYLRGNATNESDFVLERINQDKRALYGARYKVKSVVRGVKTSVIKNCWAMEQDGTLYLNLRQVGKSDYYTPFETRGRYLLAFVDLADLDKQLESLQREIRAVPRTMTIQTSHTGRMVIVTGDELRANGINPQPGVTHIQQMPASTLSSAPMSSEVYSDSRTVNVDIEILVSLLIDTYDGSADVFTPSYGVTLTQRHPEIPYRCESVYTSQSREALIKYINELNALVESQR